MQLDSTETKEKLFQDAAYKTIRNRKTRMTVLISTSQDVKPLIIKHKTKDS